jgi:hypothetical protein
MKVNLLTQQLVNALNSAHQDYSAIIQQENVSLFVLFQMPLLLIASQSFVYLYAELDILQIIILVHV